MIIEAERSIERCPAGDICGPRRQARETMESTERDLEKLQRELARDIAPRERWQLRLLDGRHHY